MVSDKGGKLNESFSRVKAFTLSVLHINPLVSNKKYAQTACCGCLFVCLKTALIYSSTNSQFLQGFYLIHLINHCLTIRFS